MKRIELAFNNVSKGTIQKMLLDYFSWEKSLEYPVMIMHEVDVYASKTIGYIEGEFRKFRVVEVYDDETLQHHVLAKVIIRNYPSGIVAFFDEESENRINEDDWGKVEKFVNRIVKKAKKLKIEVEVVEPLAEISKKQIAIEEKIRNTSYMKQFYKNYNPQTAEDIIRAIPIAWGEHNYKAGRWGPKFISDVCNINRDTVSRYLKAFYEAGITEFDSEGEAIPNPYKPRYQSKF